MIPSPEAFADARERERIAATVRLDRESDDWLAASVVEAGEALKRGDTLVCLPPPPNVSRDTHRLVQQLRAYGWEAHCRLNGFLYVWLSPLVPPRTWWGRLWAWLHSPLVEVDVVDGRSF